MSPEDCVLAACAAVLADGDTVTDPDRLPTYQRDRSTGTAAGEPIGVVFPRSVEQVSAVMQAAYKHRVPVLPRGAGSGLTGGSNALDGSLILCVEKMRDVLLVDEINGYVETQPGIFNTELRDYVGKHGMWYAPDPASKDFCSIGGNVNTNAGGLCCVKYGVTRDAVIGLEVVLADGRITQLGRRTVKGVAGYDLTGMMIGSEGTFGIVTMARLRLRPIPAPAITVVAVFADVANAGQAAANIMLVTTPSMLEVMDRASITAVENWRPMGLDTTAEAVLLIQIDTSGDAGNAEALTVQEICSRAGASEVYQSEDPAEAEMLLGARRMVIPALEAQGDWLLDDVAVPRSELARSMREFQVIAERNDVLIATFGHAGDGNLHPTIVTPRGDQVAAERAMKAFKEILDVSLECGGSVTGEHGIGSLKQHALFQELDEPSRDLHVRIKQAWDPRGILNPGKSLPRW